MMDGRNELDKDCHRVGTFLQGVNKCLVDQSLNCFQN
jgi:hypothetical protein